jgi:hypothetical protein
MRGISPAIWRLVRVPDDYTLHQLHRILQIAFSRLDYHLYEFLSNERRFQAPDPEADEDYEDSTSTSLRSVSLSEGASLFYLYDFGDWWVHDLVVHKVMPMPDSRTRDWSPRLLDGARAAPPEDAGGIEGYERTVVALGNPRHPEHEEYRAWAGAVYDPERFDPWAVDHALALAVAWGAI